MNNPFFPTRRASHSLRLPLIGQRRPTETPQFPQPRSVRPNFRINRIRRPFIHRPSDVPEAVTHTIDTIFCHSCHDYISSPSYEDHLNNCTKNQIQHEDILDILPPDSEPVRRREELSPETPTPNEDSNLINEEFGYQALGSIHNNSLTYTSEEILEDLPNPEDDVASPITQQRQPEASNQDPFSVLSDIFNNSTNDSVLNPSQENSNTENQTHHQALPSEESNEAQEEEKSNQETNGQRGGILIRTLELGPNGSPVPRMRVISLESIINGLREEGDDGRSGILGLLNMLAGLQGLRNQFGDLLGLFSGEKGLDKEVLNDLPVVTYTLEGFKNVDEESKKCTICLECYEDQQEVRFLWCMHRFHKGCVDQWLEKHTNCPFCKKDYSEAVQNYE